MVVLKHVSAALLLLWALSGTPANQADVSPADLVLLDAWILTEAPRRPGRTWIWTPRTYPTRLHEHRFPTRAELDAADTTHPVVVDCAYAFSLNSAALEAADITRNTPQPPGGLIVKDASG